MSLDPLNRVSQELTAAQTGDAVLLKGVLVHDSPLIVRLTDR